jgi:hypothetical protein
MNDVTTTDTAPVPDPRTAHPQPECGGGTESRPGHTRDMDPAPDHGEESWVGRGRLTDRTAGGFVFLASDEATYVTGETITVTGGRPLQEVVSTCPRAPSTTRHERRAETAAGVHRGAGTAGQRVSPQRRLRA